MSSKNLWGQLPAADGIVTPTQILKEQAAALYDSTAGTLVGDVTVNQGSGFFRLELSIVAPALDHYSYLVVYAQHGLELYPVNVVPGWDRYNKKVETVCEDRAQFEAAVGAILSSHKVHGVVSSLLAQSRAM